MSTNPESNTDVSSRGATEADVILIGGGIMSATLGVLLSRMRPDWSIVAYERADKVATESSNGWNNAGTGHAALCELNYTPELPDGSVDASKAVVVNQQFHESRLFWSFLVEQGVLPAPERFIRPIPHMSYVTGKDDVAFLRKRYDTLKYFPLFESLVYADDEATFNDWVPLMMEGRDTSAPMAMTSSHAGTDVNFGRLTEYLFGALTAAGGVLHTGHEVIGVDRQINGRWRVTVKRLATGEIVTASAPFIFVGAGGRAIHLLQQSGIEEARGYGGFPVSGQFLRATNKDLVAKHSAKVYGKPQVNAPPMSMPHLDTRVIDGERGLLFGPYAGFSPNYLKAGSWTDLFTSIKPDNILTMLTVAKDEIPLTLYLIRQVLQKHASRISVLDDFVPTADGDDWELIHAGQRVQTMKRTKRKRGILQFGTEVVTSRDGTVAGLLGASPGASVSTSIMLDVIERCFPQDFAAWKSGLEEIVPSHGVDLNRNTDLLHQVIDRTKQTLRLHG